MLLLAPAFRAVAFAHEYNAELVHPLVDSELLLAVSRLRRSQLLVWRRLVLAVFLRESNLLLDNVSILLLRHFVSSLL